MSERVDPIGVLDSGIGGFSVARQVQRLLPGEELIYFGDGANVPYGNHSGEEIAAMSRYMFRFMREQKVKALLVACNTISCVIPQCEDLIDVPSFNTVQAGADAASRLGLERVGVIATVFTHNSRVYPERIQALTGGRTAVYSRGCPNLAKLIESQLGSPEGTRQIEEEIHAALDPLVEREHIQCCVLGCTHYPLVADSIGRLYPELPLIDPAEEMARSLRDYLDAAGLADPRRKLGGITVYTTGDVEEYALRTRQAGLERVDGVRFYPPMEM